MLFDSFSFLIFFPVVAIVYYLLPEKMRIFWLLAAGCYFYMYFVPSFILILFSLITIDFFLALIIQKSSTHRRAALWMSLAANLGVLFFFKYFNFFNANVSQVAELLHWNYSYTLLSVLLPLGLSFHIFQSLSYLIDVYLGKFTPERNYWVYALYVMFFPQLLAGPIERPAHLLPQFHQEHPWNEERVTRGLERMGIGFFKKLVIADRIAPLVSHVYGTLPHDGPTLIITAILFSYQLYCDFSGYSDIAVGAALVLNYDIMENFNRPYSATSIADFWRRWHISLSSWFRDYLFTPLGFILGRYGSWGVYAAVLVTFALMGLWHGAQWTYVVMGILFGLYIVIGMLTRRVRQAVVTFVGLDRLPRLHHILQVLFTFALVTLTWIFFRADTIPQAIDIVSHLGNNISAVFSFQYIHYSLITYGNLRTGGWAFVTIVCAILALEALQYMQAAFNTPYVAERYGPKVRLVWWWVLLAGTLWFGNFGTTPFIYFQF